MRSAALSRRRVAALIPRPLCVVRQGARDFFLPSVLVRRDLYPRRVLRACLFTLERAAGSAGVLRGAISSPVLTGAAKLDYKRILLMKSEADRRRGPRVATDQMRAGSLIDTKPQKCFTGL